MKQIKLKQIVAACMGFALVFTMACSEDAPVVVETFADPTITVESPDLLEVLVGGTLSFTINVEAEAGLSTLNLGEDNVKTFSGETTSAFTYDFSSSENGTFDLVFTIQDAQGTSTSAAAVTVNVVGDVGFLVADFAGAETSSTTLASIDPDYWDAARSIVSFSVTSQLGSTASHENVGSQFLVETGADNPDANAALEFQGKAMKIVKQPADWGTDGWSHIMLDFENKFEAAMVESLPQVNENLDGLTAGTMVIAMDVYYDDTIDPNINFADFKTKTGIFNADATKGYLFDLSLVGNEVHRFSHDGGGYHIGYQGYLSEANVWQTVTFDALDLARVSNFFAAGNEDARSPDASNIDGVKIIPGGGYGDGQSPNALYFRNLRIIDAN